MLVGFADNVFLGTVTKVQGERQRDALDGEGQTYTDYKVVVERVIKGSVAGAIEVTQFGGVEEGQREMAAGDAPLKVGGDYLLVTKVQRDGTQLLAPAGGYANVPISSSEEREKLVREFRQAKANQIGTEEYLRSQGALRHGADLPEDEGR